MQQQYKIKFRGTAREAEFWEVLVKRVDGYFETNNLSEKGNIGLRIKSGVMLSLYLLPYVALILFEINSWVAALGLVSIMGLGKAGIGMSITHDASHGAYSESTRVNRWMSRLVWLIGNNEKSWEIQHNYYHHNFTNLEGQDEDLGTQRIMVFSEHAKVRRWHKWQYLYAWPLYSLLTVTKLFGEIFRISVYAKQGLPKSFHPNKVVEYWKLFFIKTIYLFFMIVLPTMATSFTWWQVCIGFLVMHAVASFILSIVFQLAHIVEGAEQPEVVNGTVNRKWPVHELASTANFKTTVWFQWFIGCLNHQIEHHLFRHICHVHYPAISVIVRDTAEEFDLEYKLNSSFIEGVKSHYRRLKELVGGKNKGD